VKAPRVDLASVVCPVNSSLLNALSILGLEALPWHESPTKSGFSSEWAVRKERISKAVAIHCRSLVKPHGYLRANPPTVPPKGLLSTKMLGKEMSLCDDSRGLLMVIRDMHQ